MAERRPRLTRKVMYTTDNRTPFNYRFLSISGDKNETVIEVHQANLEPDMHPKVRELIERYEADGHNVVVVGVQE